MENYNYGLMVFDPNSKNEEGKTSIVHFCLYETEPTQKDMFDLREELKVQEEFGLTDIVDRLEIAHAPQYLVDLVRGDLE